MTKTDPRAAASIALRDATAVYNAAVAEAAQAEDAHAQAEYRVAQRAGDVDAGEHNAESKYQDAYQYSVRTGAALNISKRAVAAALAERNRLYNIYLESEEPHDQDEARRLIQRGMNEARLSHK